MGHHVVDKSFSIIILSKALTDTSRGVITIFQEFLTLMLSLKLLDVWEASFRIPLKSPFRWFPPNKGVASVLPREHKDVAFKENKHWEGGKHHWTYRNHGNWFQVSEDAGKETGKVCKLTLANYGMIFKGETCDACLWHQDLIIIVCLVISQTA